MIKNTQQLRHALYRIKASFLYKSRLGVIVRNAVWEELPRGKELRVIYKKTQDVFKNYDTKQIHDKDLIAHLILENKSWTFQDDIIFELDKEVLIEPGRSLAFAKPNKFISQTRSKVHKHVIPPARYAIFSNRKRKKRHFPELIHCDGYAGKNLYHFIDDGLNPLLMLLKSGLVDPTLPVLIHEEVYQLPYVQYFLHHLPSLRGCNWLVQKSEDWISSNRLYKGVASHTHWATLYMELCGVHEKKPHRRIFLNRKAAFQRTIKNFNELESILKDYGFEIVYAEDLTYEQQVTLFNETQCLVAIHGAGISNLLHSELSKVRLLEVFSSSLVQPHYYWVFKQLDLQYYDAVIGSEFDVNWNYDVNTLIFQQRLAEMMRGIHSI